MRFIPPTYQQFLETLPAAALMVAPSGLILCANREACTLFGYALTELPHQSINILLLPNERANHTALFETFFAQPPDQDSRVHYRLCAQHKAGHTFFVDLKLKRISQDGEEFAVCIVSDATRQQQIEDDLRQRKADLVRAQAMAHVGSYTVDYDAQTISWSIELKRIYGCEDRTPTLDLFLSLIHPDDLQWTLALAMRTVGTYGATTPWRCEYRIVRPDGGVRWVHDRTMPLETHPNGQPKRVFGTILDITERKVIEEALREAHAEMENRVHERTAALEASEKRYRSLFNHIPEIVAIYTVVRNAQGEVIQRVLQESNKALLNTVGVTAFEAIRDKLAEEIFGAMHLKDFLPLIRQALAKGEAQGGEATNLQIGRDYLATVVPLDPDTYLVTGRDISAINRAEQQLRESEERMRLAMQAGRIYTFEWHPRTDEAYRSENVGLILGLEGAATNESGSAFFQRVHPADREVFRQVIKNLTPAHDHYTTEYQVVHPNGEVIALYESAQGSFDAAGTLIKVTGVAFDITKRKALERQLQQVNAELEVRVLQRTTELEAINQSLQQEIAERKRAEAERERLVSQLRHLNQRIQAAREEERRRIAREIHDEFGQILTAFKMDLAWLAHRFPKQPQLVAKTRAMAALVDSAVHTVRSIATDLRPGLLDELGIVAAIEWQVQDFSHRTGLRYSLRLTDRDLNLRSELTTAFFRILQEALSNIVRHSHATQIEVEFAEKEGLITLKIRDNGQGIELAQIDHPLSLGFMGMRERAHSVGGCVIIESQPQQGVTVIVQIPVSDRMKETL